MLIQKYPIPKDWRWTTLKEVTHEALPGFACGKRSDTDGFVQLRMNNITSHGKLDLSCILKVPATSEQVKKYQLLPGDVIFNNTNSVELVGKTALFNEGDGIFLYSNHLTRLRSIPESLDSSYLVSWLQLLWQQRVFENICDRWIGQAAVQREKLLNLEIPLPSIAEQKRISAKLKELMQKVDLARDTCEKQLEAAGVLPDAYFRKILESKEAKKWERKKIKEVCEVVTGATPRTYSPANWNGDILWATPNDLGKLVGFTIEGTERKISEQGFKSCSTKLLPAGSVLLTTRAPIGHLAINLKPMCTNQGFKSLIPSSQLHNWFLFFTLKHYVSALKSMGRGQTFTEVSKKQIENFKIPLPSLAVQLRVALDIKEKNTYIKELCANVEKQLEAINMLSQVIIAGAFKGGL